MKGSEYLLTICMIVCAVFIPINLWCGSMIGVIAGVIGLICGAYSLLR